MRWIALAEATSFILLFIGYAVIAFGGNVVDWWMLRQRSSAAA